MEQNLSLYRVFYTVANTGNISKAAEQLFISQPAISKSIRKLEQSLDVTLFSRTNWALVIYILESVQLYVNLCFCLIFRNLLKHIHI